MATETQETGRVRQARRMDAVITASPLSAELLRDGSIENASRGAWQPSPGEVLIQRVSRLGLGRWQPERLSQLADTLDALALTFPRGMGRTHEDEERELVGQMTVKVRGQRDWLVYSRTDAYRRIGMACVSALTVGAAAQAEFGITDAEVAEHDRMEAVREQSQF